MNPHFTTHTIGGGHVRPGQSKGSGYHYRPGGEDFPDRRLVPGSEVTYPNGVYEAEPEFFDPTMNPPAGAWKPKAGNGGVSTFFPNDWTPAQVDNAVAGAFKNSTPLPGNMWAGTYKWRDNKRLLQRGRWLHARLACSLAHRGARGGCCQLGNRSHVRPACVSGRGPAVRPVGSVADR
ncbi:EndoU domain-containing protein [Paractinoplanes atraurantiacus]|uniref:EndoU domain-containing protein n=1 Tax=Paractinoplanes atraurantiacus TaxID=1036182 RepID=UPI001FE56472|nr:EndoU domain-containing protein [Actinoplanes atraurantiacus]